MTNISAWAPKRSQPLPKTILSLFGLGDLDVSKPTVEFDLAAKVGQKAGAGHCIEVYARCPYNEMELMKFMRDPSTGNLV